MQVHKLILCATNPILLNQITGKDGAVTEMTVSSDVSPPAVESFIHYLYTGELKLDKTDLADVEKLVAEYGVDSLRLVLDKDYGVPKSVHTQTEATADIFDLVKHKQLVRVQELGKSSSKDPKTSKGLKFNRDTTSLTQNNIPGEDDRLLESDEDNNDDIDMDYGASIDDDEDDLLNDSSNHSVVNTPSTSVLKAMDQRLDKSSTQTSKNTAKQSSSAKSPVKTEPKLVEHKAIHGNESKISPRVRFPNIAAGLQAIKEAREKRETGRFLMLYKNKFA